MHATTNIKHVVIPCPHDALRPLKTPQSELAFILLNPQEDYRNYGFVSGTLYRRFIGANSKD
jgi:hypothetical protein